MGPRERSRWSACVRSINMSDGRQRRNLLVGKAACTISRGAVALACSEVPSAASNDHVCAFGLPSRSPVGKQSACNAGDLGQEDPLEKGTATHSSILAWRIPRTEEPGGLQSMGLQRLGHSLVTKPTINVLLVPAATTPLNGFEDPTTRFCSKVEIHGRSWGE